MSALESSRTPPQSKWTRLLGFRARKQLHQDRITTDPRRFSTIRQRLTAIRELSNELPIHFSAYSIQVFTSEFFHSSPTLGITRSTEATNCIRWRRWSNPTLLPPWDASRKARKHRITEGAYVRNARSDVFKESQCQYDQLELLSSHYLAFTSYVLSPQKVSHRKLAFPKYSSQFAHKRYRFRATEIRFVTNEPSTPARPSLAVTRNGRRSRRTCRPTAYSGSRITAWIS